MKRCCDCKKRIWFWQKKSNLDLMGSVHAKCHAKSLSKSINSGELGRIPFPMWDDLRRSNIWQYMELNEI